MKPYFKTNMIEERGYSLTIRTLHWVMAFIMITMLIAGLLMVYGPWDGKFPPMRGMLYDYHRGMGFVLLVLVIVRIFARFFTKPPSPLPDTIRPIQKVMVHVVHGLMYLALVIHPVFGWYATNLWGVKDIPVFGLFTLPTLAEKNRELGNQMLELHGQIGIAIAVLISLHIAGVMYHQFIARDSVLQRMLKT